MNSVAERSFRTKTGTCTITPQQIVLNRQGFGGNLAKLAYGESVLRLFVIYGALGVASLALGVWEFTRGNYIPGVLLCVLASLLLWNIIASRRNSAGTTIERSTVKSVDVHAPHPPLTRGYIAVHFLKDGKERKRLIMLPGTLSGGNEEFEKAIMVMREAGLLSKTQ